MIRVRRRGTTRSTPLLLLVATLIGALLLPTAAGGQTIAQTQKEIAQLSATLSQQEKTSEITANAYDAAKSDFVTLTDNIINLKVEEVKKRAKIKITTAELVTAVVRAYVDGAADAQILSLFNQNVTQSDARTVYEDQVIGDLNKLKDTLEAEKKSLDTTIVEVAIQRSKAQQQTVDMQDLLAQNVRNETTTQALSLIHI